MNKAHIKKYFLPYQERWLGDASRLKIWEKSRRIGATYIQSYEDVSDCVATPNFPVWFSSADESAAKEYILYCEQWAKLFDMAAKNMGEVVIEKESDIKAFVVEFANGSRINALRSNPKALRSKGGKIVLDEFAWHDSPDALWSAARPCIMWGFPIRILSTHNGMSCRYYRMVEDSKKEQQSEKKRWSLHTTTIYKAALEGLVDKIYGKSTTEKEKEEWLADERATCMDENTWLQEYCCVPIDESTAFLSYDLIAAIESDQAGIPALSKGGTFYVGVDIGRRRDLFVIWVLEVVGDILWTREVFAGKGLSFAAQDKELDRIWDKYRPLRICIDQTGMGEKPVEDAQKRYGQYTVEGVVFTGPVKQELAFGVKRRFEDRQARIPVDRDVREDLHSVRKVTTAAGNIRFDAERTEKGHADRFWALALAVHAGSGPNVASASAGLEVEKDWYHAKRKSRLFS